MILKNWHLWKDKFNISVFNKPCKHSVKKLTSRTATWKYLTFIFENCCCFTFHKFVGSRWCLRMKVTRGIRRAVCKRGAVQVTSAVDSALYLRASLGCLLLTDHRCGNSAIHCLEFRGFNGIKWRHQQARKRHRRRTYDVIHFIKIIKGGHDLRVVLTKPVILFCLCWSPK